MKGKRGLSNDPQRVSRGMWYYEEEDGLCVVKEITIEGRHVQTDMETIPWRMVCKSVERYGNSKSDVRQ